MIIIYIETKFYFCTQNIVYKTGHSILVRLHLFTALVSRIGVSITLSKYHLYTEKTIFLFPFTVSFPFYDRGDSFTFDFEPN